MVEQFRVKLAESLDNLPDDAVYLVSGGVDSLSLASFQLSRGKNVVGVMAGFNGHKMFDESFFALKVKKKYPNFDLHIHDFSNIDLLAELPRVIKALGEPIYSGAYILQYLLFEKVSKMGKKNVVLGQWSDELFGGYTHLLVVKAKEDLKHFRLRDCWLNLSEYVYRQKKVRDVGIYRKIIKNWWKHRNLKEAMLETIPNMFWAMDIARKTAKPFGINIYCPYYDLFEFAYLMPPSEKVRTRETKSIVRRAMRGITPDSVLDRREKYQFFGADNIWFANAQKDIRDLRDPKIDKLFDKFLNNPRQRWYKDLWLALSSKFL